MSKNKMRVVVTGKQRPTIDVEAMTRIVIALGREWDARKRGKRALVAARGTVTEP